MDTEGHINPIALRSRKLIIQALLELMEEHPFRQITIKEIMYRAKLVRRTFYGHFSSKEEILQAYLDDFFDEYIQKLATFTEVDTYSLALVLFEFCERHKDYLRLLKKNDLSIPGERLESYLWELVTRFDLKYPRQLADDDADYAAAYFVGGAISILNRWVDEGMTRSPEEMATIFAGLID